MYTMLKVNKMKPNQ